VPSSPNLASSSPNLSASSSNFDRAARPGGLLWCQDPAAIFLWWNDLARSQRLFGRSRWYINCIQSANQEKVGFAKVLSIVRSWTLRGRFTTPAELAELVESETPTPGISTSSAANRASGNLSLAFPKTPP